MGKTKTEDLFKSKQNSFNKGENMNKNQTMCKQSGPRYEQCQLTQNKPAQDLIHKGINREQTNINNYKSTGELNTGGVRIQVTRMQNKCQNKAMLGCHDPAQNKHDKVLQDHDNCCS